MSTVTFGGREAPHFPLRLEAERLFSFSDLGIGRVAVPCQSSHGTPFVKWVSVGMPKLPPESLDCVCYLYFSPEEAEKGVNFGGTAFLTAVRSKLPNRAYLYAVTNWHVAVREGASVLRVNTHDGKGDVFNFGPHEWTFDPRFDVAVRAVTLDTTKHKYKVVPVGGFILPEHIKKNAIGPGENVFMAGRFVDHDGGPVNRPAVRFGHISVMPTPMEQGPNAQLADAYCIDVHSRSGYSGSPVFVYRTAADDLSEISVSDNLKDAKIMLAGPELLGFLGIHFAQFPEEWELVVDSRLASWFKKRLRSLGVTKAEGRRVPIIKRGAYVEGLSGMTCVLPAWHVLDVLDREPLKQARDLADRMAEEELRATAKAPPKPEPAA